MRFDYALRTDDRPATIEPSYRSRGEASIAAMLERHDIPFVYERPVMVYEAGRQPSHAMSPRYTTSMLRFNGYVPSDSGRQEVCYHGLR